MTVIEWAEEHRLAPEAEIDAFEIKIGVKLHESHRWFLSKIANGGGTVRLFFIPAINCEGGAGRLRGFYGINRPEAYYNFETVLRVFRGYLPSLFPFGFDEGNGQIFIRMLGNAGELVYTPWDQMQDEPVPTYHVADSISQFLENLEEDSEEEDLEEDH